MLWGLRSLPIATRKASVTERHKSAITDHTCQENHVINWDDTVTVDREQDRKTRWIKDAVAIKMEGCMTINRDEGQYWLPSVYDGLLTAAPPSGQ